uniref:Uncharacterized protein n=1 Tax=Phytophthora fragariae TaxID=53985 RepID=A0A6A3ES83_9STRA|nr:hypothetical protein PF009_g14818 [Phytophthora fragariae]
MLTTKAYFTLSFLNSTHGFHADCTARLIVWNGLVVDEKNWHSCEQEAMADVADVRHDISLVLQERALQELAAPLAVLRRRVYDEFKRKRSSATLNGILRTRGVTIIKNVRQNATGAISSGRLKARLCAA